MSKLREVTHYTQSLNQSQNKSQEEKRKGLTIIQVPPQKIELEVKVLSGK